MKCRKATGPDNIPPWKVNNYAHLLSAPVTAIFSSSLREGNLPDLWKTAIVVPVAKKHPPGSLESDIRPISLTPILAKVCDAIVFDWVDDVILRKLTNANSGDYPAPVRRTPWWRWSTRGARLPTSQILSYECSLYPCRLQQSVRSHQPWNTHCETLWHGPSCTSCKVDGSVPDRPSTVRQYR